MLILQLSESHRHARPDVSSTGICSGKKSGRIAISAREVTQPLCPVAIFSHPLLMSGRLVAAVNRKN